MGTSVLTFGCAENLKSESAEYQAVRNLCSHIRLRCLEQMTITKNGNDTEHQRKGHSGPFALLIMQARSSRD
jgi:hypothetical protein